ncbi:MAG: hypothetical protein ACFFAY_08850 [Promethearchaeota archaeon]
MKIGSIPRSSMILLDKLLKEGPLTPSDMHQRSNLAPRTISYALKHLQKYSLCKKQYNLVDMRQPLYYADRKRIEELEIDMDRWRMERRIYFRLL